MVWKLDRLGRSLRDLIDVVNSLQDRGVGLRSLQEAIDTTTPAGKLTFHIFAALAEFERDMIRERTRAGLVAAHKRGVVIGRPKALPQPCSQHVSPIEWDHVILYGQYVLDRALVR